MNEMYYWIILIIGVVFVGVGVWWLMFPGRKGGGAAQDKIAEIQRKHDPQQTRYEARREAKSAASRAELLAQLNNEGSQLVETINRQVQAIQADLKKETVYQDHTLDQQKKLADHSAYLALAENSRAVAQIATQMGIPVDMVKDLVLEKARIELEVEKHRRIKEIDFNYEQQMAALDTQMAELKLLLPYHELNVLNNQLSGLHKQLELIQNLPDGEYKERELKRVQGQMKAWSKDIRERQKRLSQGTNGQDS